VKVKLFSSPSLEIFILGRLKKHPMSFCIFSLTLTGHVLTFNFCCAFRRQPKTFATTLENDWRFGAEEIFGDMNLKRE
jgi:hypothetical protein